MPNTAQSAGPIPVASRPYVPDYGIPENADGLLPWSHVEGRLKQARNYWLATTRPDGRPHAVPVWGVYADGTLYFGGGPAVRWVLNLEHNPAIAVHLESGDDVVIVEGTAQKMAADQFAPDRLARYQAAYQAKYDMPADLPVWVVRPRIALAWTRFPDDATRWVFPG